MTGETMNNLQGSLKIIYQLWFGHPWDDYLHSDHDQ